jgi:glycosyltransferase involved in cell wall biosynthesis
VRGAGDAQRLSARLRVLGLVDSISSIGGAERVAAGLARDLDPERFYSMLCVTRRATAPTLDVELRAAGVTLVELERRVMLDVPAWYRLVQLLRRKRVDVLHAHMFGSNVWGAVLGRLAGVPVVIAHEHGWSYDGRPLRRLVDREIVARGADAYIAVSDYDRRQMMDVEGIPAERIRVVQNGIPPLVRHGHDVRAELGIAAGAAVIGTVCELRPEKALDVLVDAAAALADVTVLIVGDGPEEARLRARIRDAGVDRRVRLLGRRDDVADVLAAFDVAVCCSDFEAAPLSVMEYMAAALPVVATRVGGLPDLVRDDETGVLVERRDPAALAAAVTGLLDSPAERRRLGAAARDRQRRDYDFARFVNRIEELYLELRARSART